VQGFLWPPRPACWNDGRGLGRIAKRAPDDGELRDGIRLVAQEIGQTCGGEVSHTNGGMRTYEPGNHLPAAKISDSKSFDLLHPSLQTKRDMTRNFQLNLAPATITQISHGVVDGVGVGL